MEWISFSLNQDKQEKFKNELMPMLCKRYGSLLEMSDQRWMAYFKVIGKESYQCFFHSDSQVLLKFVRNYAGNSTQLFTKPDIREMEIFGPEELSMTINATPKSTPNKTD